MFDTILGLPVHSLVVHAVVVLVPLCGVGVVVMAVSRTWRERLRWPVLLVLTFALGSTYVAQKSGEALRDRIQISNPDLTRHVDLGDKAKYVVFLFWLVTLLWLLLEARRDRAVAAGTDPGAAGRPGLLKTLAVLSVVGAVGATGWIVWTGHAGSASVWRGVVQSTNSR